MNVDKNLENESGLVCCTPIQAALGKEVLDNYRGEKVVASALASCRIVV